MLHRALARNRLLHLAFGGLSISATAILIAAQKPEQDLSSELPRIPPTSVADAQAGFKLHEGFELRPIATEPIVTDPVHACYDANGRMYVVEMRGYPYPENVATGGVALLEDADDDGVFEKRTQFLDGLSWPTSVVPYDGGVFISVPPDILYARDTDGDGKADVRKLAFSGFGTQNVQALLNGLLWGPDGWIYGVGGGNGGDIKNHLQPDRPTVSIRGRDFRFKPDGSAFEATSGGGQFGHSFDDWGHRFTCNNSNHIRQIVLPADALERNPNLSVPAVLTDIAAEGGAAPVYRTSQPEPWRVVRTRQRVADPEFAKRLAFTERFAFGYFTSATGVTVYRGTAFPPEYRGNAFIGDVGGNLVHRKTLGPEGSLYNARRADEGVEFLTSTDNWFRPVNFTNTPGGTLLVLDMYRETIEHPASIPEPIKKHLDLTSGHDRGRIYELVPTGYKHTPRQRIGDLDIPSLVSALDAPNAWTRETAQRMLLERKSPAAPPLLRQSAVSGSTPLGRMHSLWTLAALGELDVETLVAASRTLADMPTGFRENIAALAGPFAAESDDALALLVKLAGDPAPIVRFRAALALGEAPQPQAIDALASIARQSAGDSWTRLAVLSATAHRPRPLISALIRSQGLDAASLAPWLRSLSALVAAEAVDSELVENLNLAKNNDLDPALGRAILLGIGEGLARRGTNLTAWLGSQSGVDVTLILQKAAAIAATADEPIPARVESIQLAGFAPADQVIDSLVPLLDARQPSEVQLETLRVLGRLSDPRVGESVTSAWRSLSPSARREAAEVLFGRADRVTALLDALEAGHVAAAELDPARRQQLLAWPDDAIKNRATKLVGTTAPRADRTELIARYAQALAGEADAARGRQSFRTVCATCHIAEGVGAAVGPDLATVSGRSPDDLLIHILDPNREVQPVYLNYTLATTDGRVLSGQIAEEGASSVTLKRAEGVVEVVPRSQIDELASTGLSLMPEGLEKDIPPPAMADLIAYLRSLAPAQKP